MLLANGSSCLEKGLLIWRRIIFLPSAVSRVYGVDSSVARIDLWPKCGAAWQAPYTVQALQWALGPLSRQKYGRAAQTYLLWCIWALCKTQLVATLLFRIHR